MLCIIQILQNCLNVLFVRYLNVYGLNKKKNYV